MTFTATVRPTNGDGTPTGTVTFKEGATTLGYAPLSSWQATFTTSGLSVGSHSFSAIYSGDANFAASTSDVLPWMVYQYSTTTYVWTWQNYPRQSDDLWGVWGSSSSNIFAVGQDGTIIHYNGSDWSAEPSGTGNTLTSVWGSSASDVFAVGRYGTILHYDGSVWSTMTSGTTKELWSVWGSSPSDVFAAGNGNTILHYDGRHWEGYIYSSAAIKLLGIWGSSSSDVFAVGENGAILHNAG